MRDERDIGRRVESWLQQREPPGSDDHVVDRILDEVEVTAQESRLDGVSFTLVAMAAAVIVLAVVGGMALVIQRGGGLGSMIPLPTVPTPLAQVTACGPVPSSLVGRYTRTTTRAELDAAQASTPALAGMQTGQWLLVLGPEQQGHTVAPNGARIGHGRVCAEEDLVRLESVGSDPCLPAGTATYRWTLSGSELQFELVEDGCADREFTMTGGTWAPQE